MHNTYFSYSSSIRSLRTTYVSFNDYSNERCASNYYCSCCCSFPVNSSRLNINPNLSLYGLRQSTLINFPPSRRKLVLGSKSANDRFCCRSSIYDSGCCSGCCCCVKNWGNCKENCNRIDSVDKIRVRVRVSAIRRDLRCNSVGDAEAMLSLLSDGQSESNKQNVVIGKYEDDMKDDNVLWGSGYLERRRVKERLESTRDCSRKKGYRRSGERERESIMTDDPLSESGVYEDVKDDVLWRSGYLETRLMKERLESKRDCSRKEGYKRRGERERLDKFEYDDEDDEVKHERFVGESLGKKRKELRKMGGVVISEVTSDVLESRKDEKGEKLGSSRVENVKLGSSTEWDWRKKSEKKLTDVSNEFTRSKEESIMNKSKLSRVNESSSFMGSSSKKRFSDVEEELTSDVSSRRQSRASTRKDDGVSESITDIRLHELSKSRIETGNQVSEQFVSSNAQGQSTSVASSSGQLKSRIRIDSQETDYNQSSQTNRQNVESTSKTMVRHVSEQGAVVVDQLLQETGCDHCKTCGRSLQEKQAEFDSKRHTEVSEFHGDARHSTFVQSESESRRDKQETSTSSSQTLVKETSKKRDESHLTGAQVDAGIVSGNYSETMGSDYSSEQSRLSLQKQPEMHIQILEGNSTSVEHDNKKLQEGSSDPQVLSTSVEINRHSASSKINDEKSYSTSKFKSVKESVEKHKLVHETFVQSGNFSGDAKVNIGSSSQTGVPKVSEVEAKSEASEMPPSFQLTEIVSSGSDPESGLVRRNSTGRTTGIDSDVGYSRPQARRSSSPDAEFVSGTEFVEESSEDAISSLERMHESSAHIVGEFVETMRHDSSASKTEIHEELSQVDEATFVKQHLSHLSGGSRPSSTKGEESLEGEIAETVVAKRTGKSLWNAVSRPFRLQWGSSSETKKSPIKSSQQQRLSNESESDETWFSGNEHDEGNDDSMKQKEQITSLQEPTSDSRSRPPLRETSSRRRKKDRTEKKQRHTTQEPILDQSLLRSSTNESQKGDFGTPSLDDRPGSGEGYVASSASASQDVSISGSVSIGSNTDLKMTQQTLVSSPSSSLTPSAGRLRRSDAFEETDEIGKRLSSTSEQISELKGGVSMDVMESGFPALEETDAQRKQRKLLRSKQVLSDRFDEWEDAYARENEVRKVDENFMREALAEALKAADSWEVPVGAVLVQSGKIIARGYNLVEGLRDSTAHAEMICIREASNVLRTWRLSETTLYVTLEPCPMCAGAILQARIGTLVWGAPNKLLGADGSWIRLFPEGVEGGERSEVADKPAAPAHPFHPKMTIRRGVLESECGQVMQQFFQLRRKKDKESKDNKSDDEGQPSCLPVPHNPAKLLRKMHGVLRRT